jgi:hypothetical protein
MLSCKINSTLALQCMAKSNQFGEVRAKGIWLKKLRRH